VAARWSCCGCWTGCWRRCGARARSGCRGRRRGLLLFSGAVSGLKKGTLKGREGGCDPPSVMVPKRLERRCCSPSGSSAALRLSPRAGSEDGGEAASASGGAVRAACMSLARSEGRARDNSGQGRMGGRWSRVEWEGLSGNGTGGSLSCLVLVLL
jgi:hypothetical protein